MSDDISKQNKVLAGERRQSQFADDIIVYISNPKESTKTVLELNSNASEVAGYEINA